LKYAVVERVHRTIRDRQYKYFTYKNTYRSIDVLPIFLNAYNNSVHSTTGMAQSRVTDSDVVAIWNRMEATRVRGSRRESDDSCGAARAHQQGEDAVCQGCQTDF